jgi:hypothetical protein
VINLPLIPAKAGTQIIKLAFRRLTHNSSYPDRLAPDDLGPGLRRDERI